MASVPTRIDGPVAVIGDVHGQTSQLREIIAQLAKLPDIHRRWIVFIGDIVDRGPDPAGAVNLYCDLAKQHDKVTWLCGNHELAMAGSLGLFDVPDYIDFRGRWTSHYSSESTFESYGVQHNDLEGLRAALPEEHVRFLSDLPWAIEHREYLFVHAGLDRNIPFETQIRILRERDFTLSHPPWLYSKDFILKGPPPDCPVPVVIGHVAIPKVQFGNGTIAIDTTGGFGGALSCVLLPENIVLQSSFAGPAPAAAPVKKRSWW